MYLLVTLDRYVPFFLKGQALLLLGYTVLSDVLYNILVFMECAGVQWVVQCPLFSVTYSLRSVECEVCSVQFAVCVVCSVHWAVCSV